MGPQVSHLGATLQRRRETAQVPQGVPISTWLQRRRIFLTQTTSPTRRRMRGEEALRGGGEALGGAGERWESRGRCVGGTGGPLFQVIKKRGQGQGQGQARPGQGQGQGQSQVQGRGQGQSQGQSHGFPPVCFRPGISPGGFPPQVSPGGFPLGGFLPRESPRGIPPAREVPNKA